MLPDQPIASGRDADIFAAGEGRVRRRTRDGRSQALEARVMEWVVEHDYPAPRVHDISDDGSDMVMDAVDGPTMLDDLGDHPWRMRSYAHTLADLHHRLGAIAAPPWLPDGPVPGDRVVHLDLHPQNVLMSRTGAVVIDWTNARAGTASSDVALTWLLMACAEIPGPRWKASLMGVFRRALVSTFVRRAGRAEAVGDLRTISAWKERDANMHPAELATMQQFVERNA